ncbi:hypothetical protein AFLA70_77g002951, partial [Aspergillus flavus AF70]
YLSYKLQATNPEKALLSKECETTKAGEDKEAKKNSEKGRIRIIMKRSLRQGVAKTQPDLTDLTETSASEIAQKG